MSEDLRARPVQITERHQGLDTLRALAIMLVLMYHYMAFVSGQATFGWLSTAGWIGVDLFFALSGYLVGNQVIRSMQNKECVNLTYFYSRRILRTWPLFWLVLAAYFIFPEQMGGKPPPPLWRFLTFTQNLKLQPGTAFSHAWSLCIEEQFYLLLPLVVVAIERMRRPVCASWVILVALTGSGVSARYVMWLRYGLESGGDTEGYFPYIYYSTLCRFDEFLPGVAVALLRNCHPQKWQAINRHGAALFYWGLVAIALASYGAVSHYYIKGLGYPLFMTVFGYSLISASFALLVASALCEASPLSKLRIPGACQLAAWSYAIYLSHKAVYFIVGKQTKQLSTSTPVQVLVIGMAVLAVGSALHYLVERPTFSLRSRLRAPTSA